MLVRLLPILCLLGALWPLSARAQLDDLLSPLTPAPAEKPEKKKPKPAKKKPARPRGEAETAKAKLQVSPSPSDRVARLFVDGQDKGEIPGEPFEIDAGHHVIEVRRPGFADFRSQVELKAGDARHLIADLVPVSAVVDITANVEGAEVMLDGRKLGETPLLGLTLPPGSYSLVVRKTGHSEERSLLPVRAGREYAVQATLRPTDPRIAARTDSPAAGSASLGSDRPVPQALTPSDGLLTGADAADTEVTSVASESAPPLYRRWYFWTAVGAVAAGTVTAVALSQSDGGGGPTPSFVACQGQCTATLNR